QPGTGDAVDLRPLAGDPSGRPSAQLVAPRKPEFGPARDPMFEVIGVDPGFAKRHCRALAHFPAMGAVGDDGTPLGQLVPPMIDLSGQPTGCADDHRVVGVETRTSPDID